MTNEERDLFVKARDLLTKSKFHYNKDKEQRDIVVEKIQDALIIHASNILANLNEKTNQAQNVGIDRPDSPCCGWCFNYPQG